MFYEILLSLFFFTFVTFAISFFHHLWAEFFLFFFSSMLSVHEILVFNVQSITVFFFPFNEAAHSCAYHNRIYNVHISHWSFYIEIEYSIFNLWVVHRMNVGTLIGRSELYSACADAEPSERIEKLNVYFYMDWMQMYFIL